MSEIIPVLSEEQILNFQRVLMDGPTQTLHVVHHFAGGVYGREMHIPAGTPLVGKRHKTENLNNLSQGTIMVTTDEGMKRLSAPCQFPAQAGKKRVGFALTDCVWTTYHATQETDLKRIEAMFIEPEDDVLAFEARKALEAKEVKP